MLVVFHQTNMSGVEGSVLGNNIHRNTTINYVKLCDEYVEQLFFQTINSNFICCPRVAALLLYKESRAGGGAAILVPADSTF